MGCACGKNRLRNTAPNGQTYVYEFTPPTTTTLAKSAEPEVQTFMSPLEAKRAVRRAGGGTIRRVASTA